MFPLRFWKKDEVSSSEEVVEVNQVAEVRPNEEVAEVCTNEEVTEVCTDIRILDVSTAVARGQASAQKRRDRQLNGELISLLSIIEKALEKEYGSITQCPERIEKQIETKSEETGGASLLLLTINLNDLKSFPAVLLNRIDKVDLSDYPRVNMIMESPDIYFTNLDRTTIVCLEVYPKGGGSHFKHVF